MPFRYNSRDVVQAALILPQTTFAEVTDGALYRKIEHDPIAPVIPSAQRVVDNRVGSGAGNPKAGRNIYLNPKQLTIPSPLRSRLADKFLRFLCGGTIASTTNTGTPNTYDHEISIQPSGSEPLQTNLIRLLGGEEFIHAGCYVAQMQYSQTQGQEPTVQFGIGNAGHYKKISDTALDILDVEDFADYPQIDYAYHPSKTIFKFTSGSLFDLGAGGSAGRFISVNATLSVPIIIKYDPSKDVPINTADHEEGFYATVFYTDTPSASIQAVLALNDPLVEFTKAIKNTPVTDVELRFVSDKSIQATLGHYQQHGFNFAQAEISVDGQLDGNDAAVGVTLNAVEGDAVTGDLFSGFIRTLSSDLDTDT